MLCWDYLYHFVIYYLLKRGRSYATVDCFGWFNSINKCTIWTFSFTYV